MSKERAFNKTSVGFSSVAVRSWVAVATALFVLLGLCGTAVAAEVQKDDGWRFSVTPYIWAAGFSGTMRYTVTSGEPEVDVSMDDFLDSLDLAFMVGAEASKGPWSILTDVVYLGLESDNSSVQSIEYPISGNEVDASVDTGTETSIKGMIWSLAGGAMMTKSKAFEMGTIFGFRYLGLEAETDWEMESDVPNPDTGGTFQRSGSASGRDDIWDIIFGLRGRVNLGKSGLYIPYYIDIGTWTSYLTWQGVLGLGYDFKWGELMLDYRYLYYDFYSGYTFQDLTIQGPAIGLKFKF